MTRKIKINGREIEMRTCPSCKREVLTLITDLKTGRRFCHECHPDPDSREAVVTRKINEHAAAGTLDQYPLAERMADLNGEKYVKPN
jgi:hypothetical protein